MAAVVNINEVLDGHIALDLDCLDRIYLNAYVPNLQVGGQVVTFLTQHLGNEVPSPALFKRIGDRFRQAVAAFAQEQDIPCCASSGPTAPAGTIASSIMSAPTSSRPSGRAATGW